jgi:Rap1a immunity proteins
MLDEGQAKGRFRMRRSLRWPAVWLLLAGTPALAQSSVESVTESFKLDNAQALVTACTVPAGATLYDAAEGFCLGYMTGAMQLYRAAAASPNVKNFVCPGRVVTRAEMRDVFLEWAAANPERLNEPAVDSLLRAAVAKFPCPS